MDHMGIPMHYLRVLKPAGAIIAALATFGMAAAQQGFADNPPDPAALNAGQAKRIPSKSLAKPPVKLVAQNSTSGAQLPNGASSINESYADWIVDCRIVENQKLCLMSQAQGNGQTGQRYFAIELRMPKDGKTEGTILMPFGLNLDAGATLKLDDKSLGQGLRFSTCVPQGCLLPVSFPTIATDAMKIGKTLVVASLNLGNGEVVTFNISLNGFVAALNRAVQLGS